jgi:RecA/RadA recombinase
MVKNRDDYQLAYYDMVETKEVSWLWFPFIPIGKITIVQGDPGEGKTTLMLKIAAMVSNGQSVPDGESCEEPMNVIYQGAEDGASDTIKPRLIKAGADCSRIAFIETEQMDALVFGDDRFEKAVKECSAKLLIIDPLQAFLSGNPELQKPGGLRAALASLSRVAEENQCAVVLIGHLNKSNGGKGIYRGLGSIDIAATARSILMVGRDKDDPETRIIAQVKSSLAPEGCAYAFKLDEDKGFQWIGPYDYSAEELLSGTGSINRKLDRAKTCLQMLLGTEDMKSSDVYDRLITLGLGRRTVESAKRELGIESYKEGTIWYWHLPGKEGEYDAGTESDAE